MLIEEAPAGGLGFKTQLLWQSAVGQVSIFEALQPRSTYFRRNQTWYHTANSRLVQVSLREQEERVAYESILAAADIERAF
jgi:hypothetical protein